MVLAFYVHFKWQRLQLCAVRGYKMMEDNESYFQAAGFDMGLPSDVLPDEAVAVLSKAWYFAPSTVAGNSGSYAVLCCLSMPCYIMP
jgi:hypothetical protein